MKKNILYCFAGILMNLWLPISVVADAPIPDATKVSTSDLAATAISDSKEGLSEQERSNQHHRDSLEVHPDSSLYAKKVWRRVELMEKQNQPMFAKGHEITTLIIQGVKAKQLVPYTDEACTEIMPAATFLENLQLPEEEAGLSAEEQALGFTEQDEHDWDGHNPLKKQAVAAKKTVKTMAEFLPTQITTLELMEDHVFDNRSSRIIQKIQSIKLIIPAKLFATKIARPVASFKYKDLETYFKGLPPGKAIWFNPKNDAGHIPLIQGINMRKFSSHIVKVSNPKDEMIIDTCESPQAALEKGKELEEKLLTQEELLWER